MEPNKKRRNSILKKKTEEDTTSEIKVRRISFSGKKSIKEFIAGDAAETIWGTSYEESADDLKVSSSESGLVNLNVKRIQLRNRRITCDQPQQQNRRSSFKKKKVLIAENDKENLCVKANPPALEIVEIPPEIKPPLALAVIEQPQNGSMTIRETMPQQKQKRVIDSSSICSSTFDFINFSAQINKTITIEESLDVSLNESELQMFKFRVPVTTTEISPNTSNVLCRSILMSEDDVNILKMVRNQKGGLNAIKEQIIDNELNLIETKIRDAEITAISKTDVEKTVMLCEKSVEINAPIASGSMEISHIIDKGSKRKSERTPHSIVLDPNLLEVNSPMRKKPMHSTLYCTSMDVTNNFITNPSQNEPKGRPTNYKSVGVDESISRHKSAVNIDLLSETNSPSHTIFDSKTLNESTSFPNTTAACLAMGNQTDDISMELSICYNKVRENIETNTQKNHFLPDIQKHYMDGRQQSVQMNMEHIEQTQPLSIVKNSQTIYDSSDVEEITMPTNEVIKNSTNKKESIYTSIYMDAESPKPSKNLKTNQTKGLKIRRTILTPEGIIEDSSRAVIEPKSVLQKTISTPFNICEDTFQSEQDSIKIKKDRKTIYDPVEIQEDIPIQQAKMPSNKNKGKRESIYTSADMIEESPLKEREIIFNQENVPTNSVGLETSSKLSARNRQTIFISDDIEVDTEPNQSSMPLSYINNVRKSIYTPSDMITDFPKCNFTLQEKSRRTVLSCTLNPRHTIFTPVDIIEDNPNELESKNVHQEIVEASNALRNVNLSSRVDKSRESIYTPSDMVEDSPRPIRKEAKSSKYIKLCQPIFTPEDVVENNSEEIESKSLHQKSIKTPIHIFEDSLQAVPTLNEVVKNRQTIYDIADIEEDNPNGHHATSSSVVNKRRKSINIPSEIIVDGLEETEDYSTVSKAPIINSRTVSKVKRQTTYNQLDISLDSKTQNTAELEVNNDQKLRTKIYTSKRTVSSSNLNPRHTILTPVDIIEDNANEMASKNVHKKIVEKSLPNLEESVQVEAVSEAGSGPLHKVNLSSRTNKSRESIYTPSDMIEDSPEPIRKDAKSFKDIKTCQPIFTPEDILEDNSEEIESERLLQKSIKTPILIFEDSVQAVPTLNEVVKNRQTIYDIADIEEDNPNTHHGTSSSVVNKRRKSINIPSEIILDGLEETKDYSIVSKGPMVGSKTVSNVKRQTTYNQLDISLDSKIQNTADLEFNNDQNLQTTIYTPSNIVEEPPKATKQREPSKIQVLRRQLSSTNLPTKKSQLLQPGEIQPNVGVNSAQLKPQCASQFSFAVHKENQKRRQSIHTPVDMVEDSPKPVKPIEPSQPNVRQFAYESTDIDTDSPVEKIHQQTINNQADILIDSPVNVTAKSSEKNNRKTIHTPLEMMEDSPKLKSDSEKKAVESYENKQIIQEIDNQVEKRHVLPFRKPTKLFCETYKSLENPYSSTKSLMDKVMQEMGYSMNFQLQLPPKEASQKHPQSQEIDRTKELYKTMNLSLEENSINLSITDEINSVNHKQQTMCPSESIEVDHIQNKNKTSFDGSLMEMSTSDRVKIPKEKLNIQNNNSQSVTFSQINSMQQLSQLRDETIHKKSSNQTKFIDNENPKLFKNETSSRRQKIYESIGLSNLKSHSLVLRESAFADIDKTSETYSNMEIQNDEEISLPKAPSKRQTIYLNQDLDVEDNETDTVKDKNKLIQQPRNKIVSSQTMFLDQDLETEENGDEGKVQVLNAHVPSYFSTKTVYCYEDLKVDSPKSSKVSPNRKTLNRIEINKENISQKEPRRRTLHLNEDLELDSTLDQPESSLKAPLHLYNQQIMNKNENIEEVQIKQQSSTKQISFQTKKQQNRKTILMNQDLDVSEIVESQRLPAQISSQDTIKTNKRTYHDEGKETDTIQQGSNRQTVHFHQDLDISDIDDMPKISPQISSENPTNRQTNYGENQGKRPNRKIINHDTCEMNESENIPSNDVLNFNQSLVMDESQFIQQSSNRQTIHVKQDLDISQKDDVITPQIPSRDLIKTKRRTNYVNEDLEIDEHQQTSTKVVPLSRQTNHYKQEHGANDQQFSNHRQTILISQELDMSIREQPNPSNKALVSETSSQQIGRQTIYFEQRLEIDNEDYTIDKLRKNQKLKPDKSKPSLHEETQFHDEYTMRKKLFNETQKNTEENACRFPMTDFNNCLDENIQGADRLEEKEVTAKIASKPKRVTICDAQPLDMDESLLPKSTARKSSFSRTLNFDEVPTTVISDETSHQKSVPKFSEANWSSTTTKDDESPIYNPSLRRKCPMTPSDVDRSLAEYLKVEAALEEQDEEIFYDAEDGTESDKQKKQRQTCNVPVNIFEESGMQPLLSQPLKRQTTFSPRKMTNDESLVDYGQTKYSETPQNASSGITKPRLGEFNIDVQKDRKTLHFNESTTMADVSSTWKPSSAVESVKKLLLENTRLFSQSNLIKASVFENKRSTIFFAGNDDSMDVSVAPTDPESTPTKNKISRIPQLIGSAKKLESLKKSMEFIQQELPNIGSHLRNKKTYEDVDDFATDPRKLSTPSPKKLQEFEESLDAMEVCQKSQTEESSLKEVRQSQLSFDTIDIPRKVLSSVRKTIEELPQREPDLKKGEKPYDDDEIHQRTININPIALQESFDTVDIPRRGTTFQRNDTLYICPNEKETTMNVSQKSLFQLEDPPITISDVSTFFSNKKFLPNVKLARKSYSPNTTEALCKLNMNEIQELSRSPDSEDTTHNLAHFKKRYVDLTCDSITLPESIDNIENTHFSLVNTFEDESGMVVQIPQEIQKAAETFHPVKEQRLKTNSSVCRKCKCQRLSTTQNDTTIGSFMLEPLPVYKVDLTELEKLAKQPSIADVGKFWRQKMRESDSFVVTDSSLSMAIDDDNSESIENFLIRLADARLANAKCREQKRKAIKFENSFRNKVRQKIQSKSDWMINELLLFNNIIVLTHTRIRTFAIVIYFTPKDPRGVEVTFNNIELKQNKLHTLQWKPYEYALHYQLLVELPFDLKKICPTSEHFFDFLDHFEKVTEDVLTIGKEMLSLVLTSPASLIREPSGRLYIRKYVRTKTPQNDVKRTEVHIEVRNIKKLSYESIVMPPLYEFNENIQLLPLGNAFLRKFLNDPLKFIKS